MKTRRTKSEPAADIAIIGMASFFPDAPDLHTYWHNIIRRWVSITEIPGERWDWRPYYDPDHLTKDKINSKWGAFLPDIVFDPLTFGIPPNSLNFIETTQLLVLESARLALVDSGYLDRPFDRERTSVFIGTGAGEADLGQKYSFRSMLPRFFGDSAAGILSGLRPVVPEWNEDAFTGIIMNIAAGRVANRFNLGGANYTIDAACASALAALRAGILELKAGESDMVIVGGADTLMSPYAYTCFSKVGALSAQGQSRPFDERADGIVLGEGVATIVLKRLLDAQKDGDRVYAVIKGIAASSDGRAKSLTAPSPEGQLLALKRAYGNAGIDPKTVGLIEAHGTSTKTGDQSEAAALRQFFSNSGMAAKTCAVGSVKSMIGHTKCAAGIAALVKAVLALHHKVLPPTGGIEKPIAEMDGPDNPLYLNVQARPWIADGRHPRRAGVSAFGFGGTNFHAVLEEVQAPKEAQPPVAPILDWEAELLLFTAATRADLAAKVRSLHRHLQAEAGFCLKDLAYTLATTQHDGTGVRLAIVAASLDDLAQKLERAQTILEDRGRSSYRDPSGIYFSKRPQTGRGKIAFVFPGQGSQYAGMATELCVVFARVREVFERFDRYLAKKFSRPLSRYIYPPDAFSAEEKKKDARALTRTDIAQAAMGVVNLALLSLLDDVGLRPDMTAGHSYGEYTALYAAGVFDEKVLAQISAARGRFILESAPPEAGTMAAVKAPQEQVAAAINGLTQVWIANLNSPLQTVISGTHAGVKAAMERFDQNGLSSVPIPVACAFHSPLVGGAQAKLKAFLSRFRLSQARIPVFSNTTAAPFSPRAADIRHLLVEQLVRPVRFADEIEAMYAAGIRIFVEVGPGNVLTHLIGQILDQRPHTAVCTNKKGLSALTQLLHALAELAVSGVDLKLDDWYAHRACQQLDPDRLDSQVPPPPKTAYIIGNAGVRPIAQAFRPAGGGPRAICFTDEMKPAIEGNPDVERPTYPSTHLSFSGGNMDDSTKQPPTSRPNDVDSAVISKFQDLMSQFLETQKAVMMAYLNADESGARPAAIDPAQVPTQLTDSVFFQETLSEATDQGLSRAITAEQETAPFPPAPDRDAETLMPDPREAAAGENIAEPSATLGDSLDIPSVLLKIVSDRTGYPADMLELDLEIESDLGIDSIKRVQIMEELVTELEATHIVLPNEELAQVAGSITLREIIAKLQAIVEKRTPPVREAQIPAAAKPDSLDVAAILLGIVSDLSGYPAEMIDLNLEIESDLGIDSIKRVQITEHLVSTLEEEKVQLSDREVADLAGSITLGDIIAKLNALIAGQHASKPERDPIPAGDRASGPRVDPSLLTAGADKLPREELEVLLYRIVEIHTGYPRETLAPDLDWQVDLDIDKVRKVQILDALVTEIEEKTGGPLTVDHGQGRQTRTLNETVDWIAGARPSAPAPPGQGRARLQEATRRPDPKLHQELKAIRRFTLSARERPLLAQPAANFAGQTVLVTKLPNDPMAEGVIAKLQSLDIQPLILEHGPASNKPEAGYYRVDLESFRQLSALIKQIRSSHGAISGLLHLPPLAAVQPFAEMHLSDWRQRLAWEVKSLFYLTKLLADDLAEAAQTGRASLVAATAMGGIFASVDAREGEPEFFPGSGGVTGFLKTAAEEIPGLNVRAVDIDPAAPTQEMIDRLIDEFLIPCADIEVGYRSGRRLMLDISEAAGGGRKHPHLTIDSNWNLLITGGARGITSTIALALARQYQTTLLLVGRTPLGEAEDRQTAGIDNLKQLKAVLAQRLKAEKANVKPLEVEKAYTRLIHQREIRNTLAQLKETGAQVRYFQADVTDEAAFGRVIDTIYDEYGAIDGVIHGAGLIEDKRIRDKEVRSFERVFDTKANSLFILSRKLRGDALRFLALFSSVAGRFGNIGQADYGAANEVYNKTAIYLNRRWPGRVVSFIWGPWESRGMVSDPVRRKFDENGIYMIPQAVGATCFSNEIAYGDAADAEVVFGGWDDRKKALFPAMKADKLPLFYFNANFKPQSDGHVDLIRCLEPATDVYLRDHQLDGHPVLPMAMALEMMAEAIAYRYPDYDLKAVYDLKVFKGIVLKNGREHIRIAAAPEMKSDPSVLLKIRIQDLQNENLAYYEAKAELQKDGRTHRPHVAIDLSGASPFSLSVAEAYRKQLFHGPLWQGIERIETIGKNGIVGHLNTSQPEKYIQGLPAQLAWRIDPLLIDSGLQLVVLWMRHRFDVTPLPSQFKKYVQFCHPPNHGSLRCEVRINANGHKGIKEADLFFIKPDDQLCCMIRGLEIIGSPSLNRLAGK